MNISDFLKKEEQSLIENAICQAEKETSGEIRVHIERICKADVLDRASYVFAKLGMHQTEQRNGVLFYLAINDHKFAIIGDAGINQVVPSDFWDKTKEVVLSEFKDANYARGLAIGVKMAGEQLKQYFPYKDGDVNELNDEISFGNV